MEFACSLRVCMGHTDRANLKHQINHGYKSACQTHSKYANTSQNTNKAWPISEAPLNVCMKIHSFLLLEFVYWYTHYCRMYEACIYC